MSTPSELPLHQSPVWARVLAGVCFFLSSLLLVPAVSALANAAVQDKDISKELPWLVLPLLPALMGYWALALHRGLLFDREARTVTAYLGLGLPPTGLAWPLWRERPRPLRAGQVIEVHHLSRENQPPLYTATVSKGDSVLTLCSLPHYEQVRRAAERAAHHMDLSLRDLSLNEGAVALEDAIQVERAQHTSSQLQGEERVVFVPAVRPAGPPLRWLLRLVLMVGSQVALAVLGLAFGGHAFSGLVGACALMSLGILLFYEHRLSVSYVLRGSPTGLVVEAESIFGRRVHRLSRDEVQQIDVVRDGQDSSWRKAALLIRGSRFQRRVGAHFHRAQLRERARELRDALGGRVDP